MNNLKDMTSKIEEVLAHVLNVQEKMMVLSKESIFTIIKYLDQQDEVLQNDVSSAIQHQDILSQQFSATNELLSSLSDTLNNYNENIKESNENTLINLKDSVDQAYIKDKNKKKSFSGKLEYVVEEIEFFKLG